MTRGNANRLRVLIIGRHPTVMRRALASLRQLPILVDGAIGGAEAITCLKRKRYDVVSVGGRIGPAARTRISRILLARMPEAQILEVPRRDSDSIRLPVRPTIRIDGPDDLAGVLSRLTKQAERRRQPWYVYILECADKSLYVGVTPDLARREKKHNAGKASRYTRARLPVRIVFAEKLSDQSSALKREAELKGWRREKKIALVTSGRDCLRP